MQPAIAFPRLVRAWRWPSAAAARLVLPGVILVALLAELILAERKFAIFGGGFGQSRALDTPLEIAVFAVTLLALQSLVFYLLFRLIRRLHRRCADTPLFYFNFVFFALLGWLAVLVAKYQALAYFSDAMSFQIIRNLGGGSLLDALLFSLSETGLILIVLLGAMVLYLASRWCLKRHWGDAPALPDRSRLSYRQLAAALVAAPLLLFAANTIGDARSALTRFNSVILVSTVLGEATDFDRDGWSFFSYPIDGQIFDPARHPYALDIPGNGIDEDGFGGDLSVAAPAPAPPAIIAGRKPHVVLIVLESTRADAIGRRIGGRAVTPNLERLARAGSYTGNAYSHVGFTTESLQSLFTGRLAPPRGAPTMIGDFLANGYDVGVFSGQSEDFGNTATVTQMRDGSIFVDADVLREERAFGFAAQGSLYVDGRILLREFDERLGDPAQWQTPRFLYFNFQSAHFPYNAPGIDRILPGEPIARGDISAANADRVEETYWNAVAYNDRLIGELIDRLHRLGVYDDTLLVITADHGESLFDDGFLGHGHMLNRQQTRIPFIISAPGVRFDGPIGLADMRGIILRAAGAALPPALANDSIFQYLGTIDRPGEIGSGDARGRWTVFDLSERSVRFGEGRAIPYDDLPAASPARVAADALIDRWARERWLQRTQHDG